MSQVTIQIGGRSFDVVCQEGEESYLKTAAAMLDQEAQKLESSGARITESRMLLMAGLLLADRTAASEEKLSKSDKSAFSKTTNSEIMEHATNLESKLKLAEMKIIELNSQISSQSDSDNSRNDIDDTASQRIQLDLEEANETMKFMLDKVKSLI
ncbi:MAG: cell division protein ZapA [Amylibacter sp.]|jgi:cell division protein ZapA|nr:cell division protein ZapA [Amylibacter sp.]MDA8804208.1 cell division protein ZapA [Amylibacter sp.]|tara:strand:- start:1174 stop:1638 length:465 start_codon:yes stop_codon:yes gene_type:complete